MPIVIGNPCDAGSVPQALPIMQGRECSRSMDSGNLNHGHAIRAENLRLAGLRSVHGRIDSHIMGNMGGSAASSGNHVSDAVALAVGVGGTLMDSVKIHVVASSLMVGGWCSITNVIRLRWIIASASALAVMLYMVV